jgi:hypothetical protein
LSQDSQSPTVNQPVLPSNTQDVPSESNITDLISKGMNSDATPSLPLSQFILSNKWQLIWLNGISNLPQSFSRVYVIFTSAKIILYCPCNTYYTDYQLSGNSLTGINWIGTKNQCDVNKDNQITDYIFHSNVVRQSGEDIYFCYNAQAKLAQFQPYY